MTDLKQWMYRKKSILFKSQNSKSRKHNLSQKIAFLVDGRNEGNLKTINSYIKKLQDNGKDVSLLFLTDHSEPEKISFQAFNKKSFTWYLIPKSEIVKDFIFSNFDMLICFNDNNLPEINAIVDMSHANFKIGVLKNHSMIFDLVINPVHENNWGDYINTLENTLEQLKVDNFTTA